MRVLFLMFGLMLAAPVIAADAGPTIDATVAQDAAPEVKPGPVEVKVADAAVPTNEEIIDAADKAKSEVEDAIGAGTWASWIAAVIAILTVGLLIARRFRK